MIVVAIVIMIGGVHVISALTLDRIVKYTETSFASPKIKPELDGYVIAFITDTHYASPEKLMQIVERINVRNVDLLLLGGDYVWHGSDEVMRILSGVKTKDGVYGVEGNHDSFHDLMRTMPKYGFTLLADEGLHIKPGFYLGGITFAGKNNSYPNIKRALAQAQPTDFVLLLTHTPDSVEIQNSSKADLSLAGHTHGGQVTLFGLWGPALNHVTAYGHKFMAGWAETSHGSKIFISRGIGVSGAIRVFARPQVVFLTLRHEEV